MTASNRAARAIALKTEHPDWGYQKIAVAIGGIDRHQVRRAIEHAERRQVVPATVQPTLYISEITIGKRHRRELRDIPSLARSINERGGLLHPIVLTPDKRLIAGRRRIAAWELSRFAADPIPVRFIDIDQVLRGEYDENVERVDFTPSECVDIKRELEPILQAEAARRSRDKKPAPGRKSSGDGAGRAADKVAAFSGRDRRTVEKAEAVVEAAERDPARFGPLRDQMDKTGKVNAPFQKLKVMEATDAIRKSPPPLPMRGPYGCVVIDFPWPHEPDMEQEEIDAKGRSLRPYPAMSISAGMSFLMDKVNPLLADDCVVWFWTTNFHMPHAFQLLSALGFPRHSTIGTWVKTRIGRGQILRDRTEHCIVAKRGKPTIGQIVTKDIVTTGWVGWDQRENSRKPAEFYSLVEAICPAQRYAEIFSTGANGSDIWDCHGDQVGKFAPAIARAAERELIEESARGG